jgi:hypothetical protein
MIFTTIIQTFWLIKMWEWTTQAMDKWAQMPTAQTASKELIRTTAAPTRTNSPQVQHLQRSTHPAAASGATSIIAAPVTHNRSQERAKSAAHHSWSPNRTS